MLKKNPCTRLMKITQYHQYLYKKNKQGRKEKINTKNAEFAYYQQQDASNLGHSFKDVGQPSHSSYEEYHRPYMYDNMVMGKEGKIHDCEMVVVQNDSEVQFITPSKVVHHEPHVKKHADRIKSPFVVTMETRDILKSILPPPMDFDPKRASPEDISMKFFDYLLSNIDEVIKYGILEVNKEFYRDLLQGGWLN
ncbi:hypothetical protein FNV43_RR24559 [Rhamnella rubrinervis]|uniref:Uncharacterized protein n=1 Tax=Rhamnella rubrinervis TaxID=2594499 RepID=A0A8K0DLR7_9ROSA|nr:hypothetical protein FNV43_RR24559 [Rhamnella rubrinervis]